MIRAIFQDAELQQPKSVALSELPRFILRKEGCLWVDIAGDNREIVEPILRDSFGFHPLAIEDALQESHAPKIDDWGDYLYLVLHAVRPAIDETVQNTSEIDVFVGEHYLVTYQSSPTLAIDRVRQNLSVKRNALSQGPAQLLYQIIDEVEADYAPLFDRIDERLSEIEDQIFLRPTQSLLAEIFNMKRELLGLRRIMAPQRELIGKLTRAGFSQFSAEDRMYFHDVYDHMVQLGDLLENLRDIVNSALEIYLSAVSNRLNDVLKTLTLITTLFMPLTFIVGFFGMNFFKSTNSMGSWTGQAAFMAALVLMIGIPFGMYFWIRRIALN